MDAGGMFEEADSTFMLSPAIDEFECVKDAKFEILQLEADIFEKRSVVTADSSSEYSDYSKASSSKDPSDTGSYPGSKTKIDVDPDIITKVLRKRRLPSKSNTPQPAKRNDADQNEDKCDYCNKKGFLICCDYCPAAFHQKCHTPALESIPEGQFECYRCHYKKYYEKNPIRSPSISSFNNLVESQKYETACFMKELKTMRIVPFSLPDDVKTLVGEIPSVMPNQEFKRKLKRTRNEHLNNCYICNRSVNLHNSNQCHFCSNTLHLDCDPEPSCSTKFYAWRCPLHIENYLDTYFLDSASTLRRVKLWSQYTNRELDKKVVEGEFVDRLAKEEDSIEIMEAAKTMLTLGSTLSKPQKNIELVEYTEAERKMLRFNKSMFCTDVFIQSPKAIAVFVPAFKASIAPIIYDGRPLSIGNSNNCTFDLSLLLLDCKNTIGTQLVLRQKQGLNYLCAGIEVGGYTRVNGVLLTERPSNKLHQCKCINHNIQRSQQSHQQVYSNIAVFPNRVYTIQLGCAFFYLVFNPALHSYKPRQY